MPLSRVVDSTVVFEADQAPFFLTPSDVHALLFVLQLPFAIYLVFLSVFFAFFKYFFPSKCYLYLVKADRVLFCCKSLDSFCSLTSKMGHNGPNVIADCYFLKKYGN